QLAVMLLPAVAKLRCTSKTQIDLVLLSVCSNVAPCGREITRRFGIKNEILCLSFCSALNLQ
ncbi:MAG: hypothetical protein II022_02560, partial [Muribaculaceae bacterium]|nr:hypothetical protein [Muribaculaceae bacterium]